MLCNEKIINKNNNTNSFIFLPKESENDQEMPQSLTTDQAFIDTLHQNSNIH